MLLTVNAVVRLYERTQFDMRSMQKGYTPLHSAAKSHQKGVACLLLDRGADLEARDEVGRYRMHDV
jgi:ankyrin repeat protein